MSGRSVRRLAALVLSVLVIAAGCDGLTGGELDQFALNWHLSVVNEGRDRVSVTVSLADKSVTSTLDPGGIAAVTSFKGGTWTIVMAGRAYRFNYLSAQVGILQKHLDSLSPDDEGTQAIIRDIADVKQAMTQADSLEQGSTCAGSMDDPGGDDYNIAIKQSATGDWGC